MIYMLQFENLYVHCSTLHPMRHNAQHTVVTWLKNIRVALVTHACSQGHLSSLCWNLCLLRCLICELMQSRKYLLSLLWKCWKVKKKSWLLPQKIKRLRNASEKHREREAKIPVLLELQKRILGENFRRWNNIVPLVRMFPHLDYDIFTY